MHAFFATRGNIWDVEMLMTFLKTRVFPQEFTDMEGGKKHYLFSGLLQPIQLWSYAFPKEFQQQVFTALKFDPENAKRYVKDDLKTQMALGFLRKVLGAQPIPPFEPWKRDIGLFLPGITDNVQIVPIGMKEDVTVTHEVDGKIRTHEAI